MAKQRIRYTCQECGRVTPREMGKCPQCGAWNSIISEQISKHLDTYNSGLTQKPLSSDQPKLIHQIKPSSNNRISIKNQEFARVLGGGIVPGSMVLIGGDPGVGKSTMMLQIAASISSDDITVLYVSGEESSDQIKMRSERLDEFSNNIDNLFLVTETNLENIVSHILNIEPQIVIIDSIQTMMTSDIESSPGSINQVRNCTTILTQFAKTTNTCIFLVGHVTKEGSIAGPRVLEHTVDTVLYLEGDLHHSFRLLRGVKNRFGATSEVGVFEMNHNGMIEISNPSEIFLVERTVEAPGSAITVTIEGTRPLLVEVQGLASTSTFGQPRRTANGVDFNRLLLITAVLTRRLNYKLSNQDIFVNIIGGLQIQEPAADLAIACAIASSIKDQPIAHDTVLIGEIGLSGEMRASRQIDTRLKEAAKLGFKKIIIPKLPKQSAANQSKQFPENIDIIETQTVQEALKAAFVM